MKLQPLLYILLLAGCSTAKPITNLKYTKQIILIESCEDRTVEAKVHDTIVLRIKNALGAGGYLLQLDTQRIDTRKFQFMSDTSGTEYEGSIAIIEQFFIVPLQQGVDDLKIMYQRPWEKEPLKRCSLHLIIK